MRSSPPYPTPSSCRSRMSANGIELSRNAGDGPPPGRVSVVVRNDEYALIASHPIEPGERIIQIDGDLSNTTCRLSVQVGLGTHISPPPGLKEGDRPEVYQWRFLNHSCRPNAVIVRRVLVAIRPIEPGEEINFDYNTTEY